VKKCLIVELSHFKELRVKIVLEKLYFILKNLSHIKRLFYIRRIERDEWV